MRAVAMSLISDGGVESVTMVPEAHFCLMGYKLINHRTVHLPCKTEGHRVLFVKGSLRGEEFSIRIGKPLYTKGENYDIVFPPFELKLELFPDG